MLKTKKPGLRVAGFARRNTPGEGERPELEVLGRWLEIPGSTPSPTATATTTHVRTRTCHHPHTRHARADPPFLEVLEFGAETPRAHGHAGTTLHRRRARFNPTLLIESHRAYP